MLQKGAVLLVLAVVAGCGSSMSADKPESIERHLVYEKLIGETGIWIANADGSEPRLLVRDGTTPRISPDGKWVAFLDACDDVTHECLHISPTSRGEPRLLASGFWVFAWSPTSDRLLAERTDEDGLSETLVTIDVASGEETTVAKGPLFYGWSFSPDAEEIVFALERDPIRDADQIDLFVAGRDGGNIKQITNDGASGYPVWGPKSIAFARMVSCLESPAPDGCTNNSWGRHEIWQVQPDGSRRRPIVSPTPKRFLGQGYLGLIPLDWSDDGRALLAGWLNEWGRIPMAVDLETGDVRQLAEDQASEGLALSQDGKLALVEAIDNVDSYPKSNTVLIAPYAGGKAHLVASGATGASWNR